jgi:FG-GAP-like repeat
VAADLGVYESLDGGATWHPYSNGLPSAYVGDLIFHPQARRLRAATRNRGVWEIRIGSAPYDYDRDGKTDLAVWRPSEGNWYIIDSSTGARRVQQWGLGGDIPVPGDYDGDGRTDFAVWRPSEGNWYIIDSSTGARRVQQWGLGGDIPV